MHVRSSPAWKQVETVQSQQNVEDVWRCAIIDAFTSLTVAMFPAQEKLEQFNSKLTALLLGRPCWDRHGLLPVVISHVSRSVAWINGELLYGSSKKIFKDHRTHGWCIIYFSPWEIRVWFPSLNISSFRVHTVGVSAEWQLPGDPSCVPITSTILKGCGMVCISEFCF